MCYRYTKSRVLMKQNIEMFMIFYSDTLRLGLINNNNFLSSNSKLHIYGNGIFGDTFSRNVYSLPMTQINEQFIPTRSNLNHQKYNAYLLHCFEKMSFAIVITR